MTFADISLTGRRPDQPGVALYLDRIGPIGVDSQSPFETSVGRRYQSGSIVRLTAEFTPVSDSVPVDIGLRFASVEAVLSHEDGVWTIASDDAEDGAVPVSGGPLLAGVSYAVSLCVDIASGLYKDVIVDGVRVAPVVTDEVIGAQPEDVSYIVDVLTGGVVDPNMPEWVKDQIAALSAADLLELARQHGGRFTVTHTPDRPVTHEPRPAPLVALQGDDVLPVLSFSVSSPSLTIERVWAVEA